MQPTKKIQSLTIRGARENNLKDLNLFLPHDQLVGITGLSGSGKSSLAFDTIYAEGQRRYIETFSPYTRQFFDKVKRPKVDTIENVRPAIAIQQRTRVLNSRSTVGSMTDINDYLKIIWSNLAQPVCPICNRDLERWAPASLTTRLQSWLTVKQTSTFLIAAKVANSADALERLQTLGYSRYFNGSSQGEILALEESPPPKKQKDVYVVLDRFRAGSFEIKRIKESLEQAFSLGEGCVQIIEQNKKVTVPYLRIAVAGSIKTPSPTFEIYQFWNTFQCGDGEVRVEKPRPSLFSFNHPIGACPKCTGFGKILVVDRKKCVPDLSKSIEEHCIDCWKGPSSSWEFGKLLAFCKEEKISTSAPWSTLTEEQHNKIFTHKSKKYLGIEPWFANLEHKKYKMHVRVFLARYRGQTECPVCHGTRLKPDANAYQIDGKKIFDVWEMPLDHLLQWCTELKNSAVTTKKFSRQLKDVFENVLLRLSHLVSLGLPYLTLARQAKTLSGGETQRVNLVSAVGSNLISTHFVLDEPSVGLHARDTEQLISTLKELTRRGNSVTIVEHDPDCLMAADTILELGPAAGEGGGNVVYQGPVESWPGLAIKPFTAQKYPPSSETYLEIRAAHNRNLKIDLLRVPLDAFVCLTGVSGSGKSSLLTEVVEAGYLAAKGQVTEEPITASVSGFEHVKNVVLIDQSPLAKSPRANIATYTKIWDRVRDLLAATEDAAIRKLTKSSFSFNVNAGRCPTCEGAGYIREDMQFLSDVFIECESCLGKRFQTPVLEVKLRGKSVHDLLCMSVDSCSTFFAKEDFIFSTCQMLSQLGLGHAALGHALSELSGGEAQRLRLVPYIIAGSKERSLFLFDEPTTGLHVRDVEKLLSLFDYLREQGHSILCVEHNLRLVAAADWIIDLGPEGGAGGGEVVKEGTPAEFIELPISKNGSLNLTANYLKDFCDSFGKPVNKKTVPTKKAKRELKHDTSSIKITGAREHNLKDIDVSIPLNTFTTITGVSGSGKSTIAKDILYAEGQRRYLDCLSPYARQFIKELKKPEIDDIRNVQPTICVYQHTFQPSALSTVATMSEVYNFLRLLFAKAGTQFCPDHPEEAISPLSSSEIAVTIKRESSGVVKLLAPIIKLKKGNHRAVFQRAMETEVTEVRVDGVLVSPSKFVESGLLKSKVHSVEFVVASFSAKNMPVDLIEEGVKQALSLAGGEVIVVSNSDERVFSSERTCKICQRGFFKPDPEDLSFNSKRGRCATCDGYGVHRNKVCSDCQGTRLNEIGRSIKFGFKNIFELCQLNANDLLLQLARVSSSSQTQQLSEPIIAELKSKLGTLVTLGLDYLALNRDCATLSNGELQRLRLATAMGSPLCGVTYIFDEPSAGLHPIDNRKLIKKLIDLKDKGNTVIQIEHELDSILQCDHLIDVGPGAGKHGGEIVFEGTVKDAISHAKSPTGEALRTHLSFDSSSKLKDESTSPKLLIKDATSNNLKKVTVSLPLQRLVTIAGVSGAGKSSLVHSTIVNFLEGNSTSLQKWKTAKGSLESDLPLERVLVVDQKPIGKTSRSTPASYLGIWDEIRKIFASTLEAKSRGWTASFFSHNTGKGRCQTCKGQGQITLEMSFLAEAKIECESCYGRRFTSEADTVRFKELSISEVLQLTFEQARATFINHKKIHQICRHACDLGLGYLTLGQPSSTLSGGEIQRIKLVSELHVERVEHTLYILDEPTTGLHRSDVALLLRGLHSLVAQGHSVIVIEHDADALSSSDWVVELGPGPGEAGGKVIFEGVPSTLLKSKTPWGEALRERVALHKELARAA